MRFSKSEAGKLGAKAFWAKYRSDVHFRALMDDVWKKQPHDRDKLVVAARLGGRALWRRYHSDPKFKANLDKVLRESRARGGSISLRNLGEDGFKARLRNSGPKQVRPLFRDTMGNLLRSSFEVTVANTLASHGIDYIVEPRFIAGSHAFYPDFMVASNRNKLIEVVGYMGDRYWDGTATKIKLICESYPNVRIALVTSFPKLMERRLHTVPRVVMFRPYEGARLARWCRGTAGVPNSPTAEWLLRGP